MDWLKNWWNNGLSGWVKFVFLVLLANGLPAFIILMTIPDKTETFFVWTINPVINARLIGVMYFNALLLVAFGLFQSSWARVRVIMVVITLFSILATPAHFLLLKTFPGTSLVSPDLLVDHVPGSFYCRAHCFCDPREKIWRTAAYRYST